tara:strand:+ start:2037 stop:3239 length:1203 start_codon:yes stop_codon:yes gene_type:complete
LQTISIVGLGYIGLPTAVIFASYGFKVIGVDLNKYIIENVNKGESHISEPNLDNLLKSVVKKKLLIAKEKPSYSDIYIIAVPTPHHLGENDFYYPNTSIVFDAVESICPYLNKDNLIILESTCPVGTTDKVVEFISKKSNLKKSDINIAYCPERVLPGNILKELENNDRIIGGINDKAAQMAKTLYSHICKGEIFLTNAHTAEMAKLSENAYRDINIAFANELSIICDKLNINVIDLINISNRHPRVNILKPGCGVGGHCIAIDPWFIASQFPENSLLIQSARKVNLNKTKWVIEKIKTITNEFYFKFGSKPKIGCLGLTFKPDVDDLRESPALKIVNELIMNEYDIYIAEPNIKEYKNIKIYQYNEVLNKADLIFILVSHKEFKSIVSDREKIYDFSNC